MPKILEVRLEFKWKGAFRFPLTGIFGSPLEVVLIFRSDIPTEIRRSISHKQVLCPN